MNSLVFVRDGGGKLQLGERDLDNILPGVVCQDSPPMNIFPGSLGISSVSLRQTSIWSMAGGF